MLAFISNFAFLLSGGPAGKESAFTHFYNEYLNIPGFEAWKFINLAIFIAIMIYLVKKPLGDAFTAKRDEIRAELIKAEAEKQDALAKLTSIEARLSQLETEKTDILAKAKDEAAFEKKRLADQTKIEVERLRQQTEGELARISKQTYAELRRLSANTTIDLAEKKLRAQIDGTVDAQLVKGSISEIGGLN
ncbi:MAG TPA: ATP synthase F0 subunit B [Pyrinomonadaceae bacterium]|nr:ATP synthase F0 subunit B [Pyrinomonadaceae bacterium]